MPQSNDLSRCLIPFRQDETLVAVVEMSKTSWLVAGMIPGVARHLLKKLVPDEKALFELLERWRDEAVKAGKIITRITVAYEAGRDGFWLARWLRARGFEVYVVHSSSVAVTREHRRAKTDRLDCEMLKRVFIGWLRGERDHCRMVAIATQTQEDAKRPNRERENLVGECTREPALCHKRRYGRPALDRSRPRTGRAAVDLQSCCGVMASTNRYRSPDFGKPISLLPLLKSQDRQILNSSSAKAATF